jgi:hypothetical protein
LEFLGAKVRRKGLGGVNIFFQNGHGNPAKSSKMQKNGGKEGARRHL